MFSNCCKLFWYIIINLSLNLPFTGHFGTKQVISAKDILWLYTVVFLLINAKFYLFILMKKRLCQVHSILYRRFLSRQNTYNVIFLVKIPKISFYWKNSVDNLHMLCFNIRIPRILVKKGNLAKE